MPGLGIGIGMGMGVGRGAAAERFSQSLAIIGDSRVFDNEYMWKNVTFSDTKGLPLSPGFCTGQAITAESTGGGLLEYRASDAHLRWTAPGDTAGEWTPMFAGWNLLESGTADSGVRVGVRSLADLPGEDQSITVNVTGTSQNAWQSYGFAARALDALRWTNTSPAFLGLGGNTTAQSVEQLSWLADRASGPGYDIIQLGTNDISAEVAAATTQANLQALYDARRALGRRLVIVGEPARWGVDASTPLTEGQQSALLALNAWMESYAAANNCVFIDTFALTVDPNEDDCRPLAGMLRDRVHYSEYGAQVVGSAIASALAFTVGLGPQMASDDANNLLGAQGFMAGTGGTASGTGISGTAPTGWTVTRGSGSDATAAVDVYDRDDGIAGRWMEIAVAATSGGQIIQAALSNKTLASLGLAVGDTVHLEAELDISNVSGGLVECDAFLLMAGTSPTCYLRCSRVVGTSARQSNEHVIRRSPPMKIPVGTTGLRFFLWVRTQDSAAATVKIASVAIVKH